MQTRLLSGCLAVAVLAGFQPVRADTVTLYFDHTTNQSANITFNGSHPTVTPGPYYWKDPPSALNANTATFCVQLDQFISLHNTYTYQTSSLANMPTIGNQIKANYITELFGRYYNPAWGNPSFTGNTTSTAFQLALWELTYDGPTDANPKGNLDLSKGTFADTSSADTAAVSLAQKFLTGGSGYVALSGDTSQLAAHLPGYQLVGLTDVTSSGQSVNPGIQDQIRVVQTVPAPAGVWLAGAGLIALIGRGRLVRKKPAEATA
jgi:hypothetical protein